MTDPKILGDVASYYTARLREHGPTPAGVDWNGEASQVNRFAQLTRVITREPFSLLDVGCGYGAYAGFLQERFAAFDYVGMDISAEMLDAARARLGEAATLVSDWASAPVCDYAVASGIFNVRFDTPDHTWLAYILETVAHIDAHARLGWAANFLTKYSDAGRMRSHLYYADPALLFDWAKRNASRQVALLHDYGLYEFTLIVRKEQGP